MEAQPQHSEQANRYAEVVRGVNKVLVSGSQDQFDAVNAFLAACPEEDNGQFHFTWWISHALCSSLFFNQIATLTGCLESSLLTLSLHVRLSE